MRFFVRLASSLLALEARFRFAKHVVILLGAFLFAASGEAATAIEVIPTEGPRGARVIVPGTGLDDPNITVSFLDNILGFEFPAVIFERTPKFLEVGVPPIPVQEWADIPTDPVAPDPKTTAGYVVLVRQSGEVIAAFSFTIPSTAPYDSVMTVASGPPLVAPSGVVAADNGFIFIVDAASHRIFVQPPESSSVAVFAGNGTAGYADGSALTAQFNGPEGIAIDPQNGNVYIADTGNHAVRKITSDGNVTTVAGGPGATTFLSPAGLAVDNAGNIYVADTGHHVIKRIGTDGLVTTFAGSGQPGRADGFALSASFNGPRSLAVTEGGIYVADTNNNLIRTVFQSTVGTLDTDDCCAGCPCANVRSVSVSSVASTPGSVLRTPSGIALDELGNLLIADTGNHLIRLYDAATLNMTTIAGGFNGPTGVAFAGAIYVADRNNSAVRSICRATKTSAVFPRLGGSAGGNQVRLLGTGFIAGRTNVQIDGIAGITQTYRTSTEILVTFPSHAPGDVGVTATTSCTAAVTGSPVYTYLPSPTLSSVTPGKGVSAGGQTLTLTGTNFMNGETEVLLGSTSIVEVDVSSTTTLSFVTPSGPHGATDVTVVTTGGQATLVNGFSYFAPPVINSFSPPTGAPETDVTINGDFFDTEAADNAVRFGTLMASVVSATRTQIIVSVPAGAASGKITVTTAGGTDESATDFVVASLPPTLTSVTPNRGSVAGGQSVTLTGSQFASGETAVFFGSMSVPQVSVTNSNTATVVAPPGESGSVDITVITPHGEATLPDGFTYLEAPIIDDFDPMTGAPGTTVTINGDFFDTEAAGNVVRFGSLSASVATATQTTIEVAVPPGAITGRITVTTAGGVAESETDFVVLTLTSISVRPSLTLVIGERRRITATGMWSDGSTRDVTSLATWASSSSNIASVNPAGLLLAVAAGTTTVTATIGSLSRSATVSVLSSETLLPDPANTAPPNDPTVPTAFLDSTAFLYGGPDATQLDVAPGGLVPRRVVVVRGRVLDASGGLLQGVRISTHGDPDAGFTLSRSDGRYDLVANGGGTIVLQIDKSGYIPVQRRVKTPWQDFVVADDIVLLPYDSQVTTIDLQQMTSIAVARGSLSADEDGTRRATLLFTPGTLASMRMADGTTQPLTRINVRATEQTIGKIGAMPADLPASERLYLLRRTVCRRGG